MLCEVEIGRRLDGFEKSPPGPAPKDRANAGPNLTPYQNACVEHGFNRQAAYRYRIMGEANNAGVSGRLTRAADRA